MKNNRRHNLSHIKVALPNSKIHFQNYAYSSQSESTVKEQYIQHTRKKLHTPNKQHNNNNKKIPE